MPLEKKWKNPGPTKRTTEIQDDLRGGGESYLSNNLCFNMLQKVVWNHHSNWWLIALHYRDDGCVCNIYIYTHTSASISEMYLQEICEHFHPTIFTYIYSSHLPIRSVLSQHQFFSRHVTPYFASAVRRLHFISSKVAAKRPWWRKVSKKAKQRMQRMPSGSWAADGGWILLDFAKFRYIGSTVGPPISSRIFRGSDSKIFWDSLPSVWSILYYIFVYIYIYR